MVVVQWIYGEGDDDRVLVYGKLTQKKVKTKNWDQISFKKKKSPFALKIKNLKLEYVHGWNTFEVMATLNPDTVPLTPKNM